MLEYLNDIICNIMLFVYIYYGARENLMLSFKEKLHFPNTLSYMKCYYEL